MSDSYYLINSNIKFYFEIENLRIEFNGQHKSLEPKEARILKYVIENQVNGLINAEVILDANWEYWNDKKVLQKVLSTLRKKFKAIGVTENGFVAADANYKINYVGVLVNEKLLAIAQKKQVTEKYLRYLKIVVPSILAVVAMYMAFSKIDQGPNFSVDDIIQSTAISGASVEPDLSPDGSALVFSHQKKGSSQIYLKQDASLGFQVLTEGHYDQVPSWSPSGRQLAFQRWEPGVCEIRLIQLDDELQKSGNDEVIATCNKHTNLMSITWKDENTLYFTESKSTLGPNEIKELNLITKAVTTYFSYDETDSGTISNGSGHYFIVYNKALDSVFSLQSPDWKTTNITKVNDDNTFTFLHSVGIALFSFDIFDHQVIFKDIDNHLKSFDLNDPTNLTTIYKNPLKTISYPVVSDNSNKIALVSGSVFKNSVHSMDLNSEQVTQVMDAENLVEHPQFVGETLWFMSTETGIAQIYSYADNVKTQFTHFNENKHITYFSLSPNEKWLAISFLDSTAIYEINDGGLTQVKTFDVASFPDFSKNSERILLSNRVDNDPNAPQYDEKVLVEYYLDGFKPTGISIAQTKFGIYHDSGIIFAASNNSIKLFKLNGIETIVEGLSVGSRSAIAVNDKSLFVSNSATNVVQVDLATRTRSEMKKLITGQITVNDHLIFFKTRQSASMVIFKGELTSQD